MTTAAAHPTEWYIQQVLQRLGLQQAHVAARIAADWQGLATSHPDTIASLLLVCPRGMAPDALSPLATRLLVVSGEYGSGVASLRGVMARFPKATLASLPSYEHPTPYADIALDCPDALANAMLAFLKQQAALPPVTLPQGQGSIGSITYHVRGSGAPLVLLPLSVAPSQWEPIIPQLSAQYCTITLSGAVFGMVASLEARGHTDGYLRVLGNLMDAAQLQPGEVVLEVGCGTGVLDRWLARRTAGANRIAAVDVNRFLLQEAASLARQEGVDHLIEFHEGSAEALPFPDNHFDVTMSSTVIQRVDADRMLAEMHRVTRPGGRVAVVGHAHDMPQWVNLPLPAELKAKIEAPGWHDAEAYPTGCDESSLYQRMHHAGLTQIKMFPQFAAFAEQSRIQQVQASLLPKLSAAETQAWQAALAQANAEGTFFIATPFHCAVGTKRGA